MCPGLILGLGSEFWTQIWKVGFIYFIVTSFFFFPSQICSFFWLSSVALCEPLFLLFLYHPSDFSLSPLPCISTSYPFHSFFPPFLSTPSPTFFPFLLFHLSILRSSQPGFPELCTVAIMHPPSPPLSQSASPVPLTPHAAPIPRKPLQTASAIKAHSQSARQPVSQPASLLLRLKITVVPVARLLSSSDTHQRSS